MGDEDAGARGRLGDLDAAADRTGDLDAAVADPSRDLDAAVADPAGDLDAEVADPSRALDAAVAALRAGGVVLLPTDTVYGLAVATEVPDAIARLFELKGRHRDIPIAVLVADAEQAWRLSAVPLPESAGRLAARWWPGALTLVVPRRAGWDVDLGGDPATVGVRCPDHDLVRAVCREVGPLATTSANRHGQATPPTAAEALDQVGPVDLVIDGGRLAGAASTVVDCTVEPVRVVREGVIPAAEIAA